MKRSFFILMAALIAFCTLFVSCNANVEAPVDELVTISFDNDSARALSSNLEAFTPEAYYWKYAAKKADTSNLISGQTANYDSDPEPGALWIKEGEPGFGVTSGALYTPFKVQGFSQGLWNFTLYGYKNIGTEQNPVYKLVYSGETTGVLLNSTSNVHHVHVVVSPTQGADGTLEVKIVGEGKITLDPATPGLIPNADIWLTVEKIEDMTVITKYDGFVTDDYKQALPAGTYRVTVKFTNGDPRIIPPATSTDTVTYASGSVIATVYSNLTTTIKGNLTEIVTYADFGADQNPDIITVTMGSANITQATTSEVTFGTATDKVQASMPVAAAQNLITAMEQELGAKISTNEEGKLTSSLALKLSVDTTEATETTVTYEIGMEATLTYEKIGVEAGNKTTTTSAVKNLNDYVTVVVDVKSDISDVSVTHSGVGMIKFADSAEGYAAFVAATLGSDALIDPLAPEEGYKGFYCLRTVGDTKTLYIKTRSFSPFEVTYKMLEAVAAIGSKTYTSLEDAFAASKAGDEILVLSKDIVAPTSVEIETREAIKNASGNYNVRTIPEEIIIVNDSDTTVTITTSLYGFARRVNSGTSYSGYTATLQGDVDLKDLDWEPIGTTAHPFSGVFDGNNKTISNLTFNGAPEGQRFGLFGDVVGTLNSNARTLASVWNNDSIVEESFAESNYSVVIKNLNIKGFNIQNNSTSGSTRYTGALAGTITDAYVANITVFESTIKGTKGVGGIAGSINGTTAVNCRTLATGEGVKVEAIKGGYNIGGLFGGTNYSANDHDVATEYAAIINCINNAIVTIPSDGATGGFIGGITGMSQNWSGSNWTGAGSTDKSGYIYVNCVNNGKIEAKTSSEAGVGGIAGSGQNAVVFVGCENTGELKAVRASNIAGITYGGGQTLNCANSGNITAEADRMAGVCIDYTDQTGGTGIAYACTNTGVLDNKDNTGRTAQIAFAGGLLSLKNQTYANLAELRSAIVNNEGTPIDFVGCTVTDKTGVLDLSDISGTITSDSKLCNSISVTNSSVALVIPDVEITVSGTSGMSFSSMGSGCNVIIQSGATVNSVTVGGNGSSLTVNGSVSGITLTGNGNVSATVSEGAVVHKVGFGGNGTYVLTNNGTISKTTELGNDHTVSTIKACNITINNYGSIAAIGNSYACLFYNGCSVVVNQYYGSSITSTSGRELACGSALSVVYNTYDAQGNLTESVVKK